ncbi:MAG: class I SAM-dependent methyltransferase [Sphingomonadales bacterium]|nr:class I SAM-dependent methyltransferase [Sphingomonadales bacterium]
MDEIYRLQRHFYDVTRKYYLLGRDEAVRGLAVPAAGTVLEVGCGTARNLVALARRYPRASVFGIDISRAMLASAATRIARERLGARVFTATADATSFDPSGHFGRARFDRILFSYTLSMIPDWPRALEHAAGLLAPGGVLSIVDFGDQQRLPGWFRRALRAWLARFEVTPRDGLATAIAEIAHRQGLAGRYQQIYRGYCQTAILSAD